MCKQTKSERFNHSSSGKFFSPKQWVSNWYMQKKIGLHQIEQKIWKSRPSSGKHGKYQLTPKLCKALKNYIFVERFASWNDESWNL